MAYPTSYHSGRINAVSAAIESIESKSHELLARISAIDTQMKENVGLTIDVFESRLEAIDAIASVAEDQRDYAQAQKQYADVLREKLKKHIDNYHDLLRAREQVMEGGRPREIDKAKIKELFDRESARATTCIQTAIDQWNIKDISILAEERRNIHGKMVYLEESFNFMMDSKTPLSDAYISMVNSTHLQWLKQERSSLLKPGASTNIYEAAERGDIGYIQRMLEGLENDGEKRKLFNRLNENGFAPLHLAAFSKQLVIVDLICQNSGEVSVKDANGNTPLHWACKSGNPDVVQRLLDGGANANAIGEYGRTPLHYAAYNGHHLSVAVLLRVQACNPNVLTKQAGKTTPLHDAVFNGHPQVVLEFVKCRRLDVNCNDADGFSPLRYAIKNGSVEMAAYIVGHHSYKIPSSRSDPNHPSQLASIEPIQNKDMIVKFLQSWVVNK